ncbi:MAG: 1-acyl-sn-glycerol-3-phosphate acyltransferase [Betaproteobacteria bacterium]|nr:1-acyl-sn-glycerol-3-phosphate acyltransferase [Betaproteobacteria bacterium]
MVPTPNPIANARPQRWALLLLHLLGWRIDLPPPTAPKVLLVLYPHTSNWDFWWGSLARWAVGWEIHWIAKHTLFVGPFGWLLRRWGGVAVNRKQASGFVESLKREIDQLDTLILTILPEGTRSYVDHWKSGFLRIAHANDMPIGLAYMDYKRRTVGILEYRKLSGDDNADMAYIAAAYANISGRNPSKAGAIRLLNKSRQQK